VGVETKDLQEIKVLRVIVVIQVLKDRLVSKDLKVIHHKVRKVLRVIHQRVLKEI
jgi:hypothetical protein